MHLAVAARGSTTSTSFNPRSSTPPLASYKSKMTDRPTQQRQTSQRLVTTTPDTTVRLALESLKPQICPKLFSGFPIRKISSNGAINPRLLTLSDDLFTFFVSHDKISGAQSRRDRAKYRGFKAYAKVAGAVIGEPIHAKYDIRVIDVADVLFVRSGFVGSRRLEEAARDSAKDDAKRQRKKDGSTFGKKKREGATYATVGPSLDPSHAISIFHNHGKTMDFLVEDEEERRAVLDAIRIVREAYHLSKMEVGREERLLRYVWYDTDFDKSGLMEQSEFLQLLPRINIYIKKEEAIKMFKKFLAAKLPPKGGRLGGPSRPRGITLEDGLRLLRRIDSDLNDGVSTSDDLFDDVFGAEKRTATVEEFSTQFLRDRQGERGASASPDRVGELFARLNGAAGRVVSDEDGAIDRTEIDRAAWRRYLMSIENDVYDPEKRRLDLSTLEGPLPEYWINSSHNTYLTGDQLKSHSSVEMYVLAMHRGCKCLELDCWDDDDSGVPIIYHGYTLTSKIPFQAIITCVKDYMDANPDTLPMILSLENHCSHPFQEIMADVLKDTLEDSLYALPEGFDGPLPSPLDLAGKVIVKGKRPPEIEDDAMTELGSFEDQLEHLQSLSFQSEDSVNSTSRKIDKLKEKTRRSEKGADPPPLPKIVPELAALTLFNGVKHKDFPTSIALPPTDMHSFSETKLSKLYRDPANLRQLREYNVNHVSRIYPAGSRVDSSNYNPVVPWSSGCQLVALNFQTEDSSTLINDGRFRENGGCGYVRKPRSVLSMDTAPHGKKIRIRVLSGSCLPKPYGGAAGEVIDPYVIVRLHDVKKSEKMQSFHRSGSAKSIHNDQLEITERRTAYVKDNGFCPQWKDSEWFSFTANSDAAMMEFVVTDNDRGFIDEIMCESAVPVSCLRQGLRSVQFYDRCGSQHGPFGMARILVDVDIADDEK